MFAYYLPNVVASELSDERWAEMFYQLQNIREKEFKKEL